MARDTSLDMTAIHNACRFLAEEGFPAAARALAEKFTQGPDQCPTCYVRHAATGATPECERCRPPSHGAECVCM